MRVSFPVYGCDQCAMDFWHDMIGYIEDGFFIMMSWIDWIHDLVRACNSDEVAVWGLVPSLICIFLVSLGIDALVV